MNSIIRSIAILATVGSGGFAGYEANPSVPHEWGPKAVAYRELGVPDHLEPVYSRPLGNMSGCGTCSQGGCWSGYHSFMTGDDGSDRAYGENSHDCKFGWCGDAHPQCDNLAMALDDVEKQRIWETATTGGPSSVADLLVSLDQEVVAYNGSRNACQVRGCEGAIIMSMPLSSAQGVAVDL